MPVYLTDASIWIGARRWSKTYLPNLLADRLANDEIATCVPTALKVLTGPGSGAELDLDWQTVWQHVRWLPVTGDVMERSLAILRDLAHTTGGAHRRRPMDYVVAACAESAGSEVVLWHWDKDMTVICDFAGIPHEPEHERAREHGINVEPGAAT